MTTNAPDNNVIDKLLGDDAKKPASAPVLNLDSVVTSGGKAYTVKELLDAQEKLRQIEPVAALKEKARRFFESTDEAERNTLLPELLKLSEVPEDIMNEYLTPADSGSGSTPPPNKKAAASPEDEQDPLRQEIEALKQQLAVLGKTLSEDRTETFEEVLSQTAERAVGKGSKFEQDLSKLAKRAGKEIDLTPYRQTIQERAKSKLLALRQKQGKLSKSDVAKTVDEVSQEVYGILQPVISTASALGRVEETDGNNVGILSLLEEDETPVLKTEGLTRKQRAEAATLHSKKLLAAGLRKTIQKQESSTL